MAEKKKDDLLDGDFIEDAESENDFSARDEDNSFEFTPEKEGEKEPDLVIEVQSDAPEKDKGRWVADDEKDGEPDVPSEDELKNYSKSVQGRIKNVTARMHAERRAKEERERQLSEAVKFAEELLRRNNQLSELVENGEKVLVGEHKSRLESQLNAAKQQYREAHEAGDTTAMIAAQESIAKAAAAIDRVSTHRPAPMPRHSEEDFRKQFPAPKPQPRLDDRTREWMEKNDWYGRDQLMSAYAMGIHKELTEVRGVKATDPAYWNTIDAEMRRRFPEKFETASGNSNGSRQRRSPVAPAQRAGASEARKVILTESQVRLAKRLNITPEQYARQLVKEQRERDGR